MAPIGGAGPTAAATTERGVISSSDLRLAEWSIVLPDSVSPSPVPYRAAVTHSIRKTGLANRVSR